MAQMKIRGNTQIIAGTITNTEINASAAIASSKLADGANWVKKDGSVAMTGALAMGTNKITGLGTPTADTDAATKGYVDGLATGVDWKASVRVATTANITLSGTQTIDGVALSVGDRVLVKDQSTGSANGIYVVASGAWTRATDADSSAEVTAGMTCWVNEGTVNGDSQWLLTTNDAIVLGTTALTFTQISGLGQILAGAGLTKTGNTIDVASADGSIQVNADSIQVKLDATGLGSKMSVSGSGLKVVDSPTFTQITVTDGVDTGVIQQRSSGSSGVWLTAKPLISTGIDIFKDTYTSSFALATITSGRTWTLPNKDGTVMLTADLVGEEIPSGTINGSNTSFSLANTPLAGSLLLYQNGIRLRSGAGNDYTISGATITMITAPVTGDLLLATYFK
jgi:hypothetical protein